MLSVRSGSVTVGGVMMRDEFWKVPEFGAVAVTIIVTWLPAANVGSVSSRLPVPLAVPQVDPDDAAQLHDTLVNTFGNVSSKIAPLAALGPLLVATMV